MNRARWWATALLLVVGCPDDGEDEQGDGSADETADGEATSGGDTTAATTSGGASTDGDSDGGSSGGGEIDCDEVPVITYDTFGAGFLATYCNGCHGGQVVDRQGAPAEIVFDSREQASAFAPLILGRRNPPEGTIPMPPAGGVTPEDDIRLEIWLTCFP